MSDLPATLPAMTTVTWVLSVILIPVAVIAWLLGVRRGRAEQPGPDLLRPVGDSLDRISRRIEEVERERVREQADLSATLRTQLGQVARTAEEMRKDTSSLHAALGRSEVRGAWGEASLRRLVEAAGMIDRVHFTEQDHNAGDDGAHRPDLTIHLGFDRNLVVDAKVPLNSFLRAQETDDPAEREGLMRAHAVELKAHVDRLSSKQYWRLHDPAPDFVVVYLPSEALLAGALAHDPELLDRAFAKRVVLATPTTFFSLLRTVDLMWRQEAVAEHAKEIAALGRDLHDRLVTMSGHLAKVGKSLDSTIGHYNSYVASLESRVLVTARRMNELGIGANDLPDISQVERAARQPVDVIDDEAAVA